MPSAEAKKKFKAKNLPTVTLTPLRELALPAADPSTSPGPLISGVSGAIRGGNSIYFVSDSQATLFKLNPETFSIDGTKLGTAAVGVSVIKSEKADLESLAFFPPENWPPNGALVAFPSASTKARETAYVVELGKLGELANPRAVSISALASLFRNSVIGLNLEGLVVNGAEVIILQRGNEKKSTNGIFRLGTAAFVKGLKSDDWKDALAIQKFEPFKIGKLQKVKLTLTDGAQTPLGLVALAAAEAIDSSYEDGEIRGSVLIRIENGVPVPWVKFAPAAKLEAIIFEREDEENFYFLVFDDPDDEKKGSRIFRAEVPKSTLP